MRASIRARLLLTRITGAMIALVVLTTASYWSASGSRLVGDVMFVLGCGFSVVGFGGRMWATRHIGGQKKRQLVSTGPYSLCRHPLYFFSFLGGLGLALCTRRLTVVLLYLVVKAILLPRAIRAEERFLEHQFPDYPRYREAVPALMPRGSYVPDAASGACSIHAAALFRNTLEGLAFLTPVVLLAIVDSVQMAEAMPVLFLLP
jgi:protein-S-isoprenylcysteine O-methyltransferase Ste14